MDRTLPYLIAFSLMIFASQGAEAGPVQTVDGIRQVSVSYADLDLSGSKGMSILMTRLDNASRMVCGPEPVNTDLSGRAMFKACHDRALSRAVAEVRSPAWIAAYGKTHAKRFARR